MLPQTSVAVIGGGISGLSCAYELSKKGLTVKVFEKERYPGGRMATRLNGGLAFDTGAQLFGKNYTSAYQYCKELGIEDDWEAAPVRYDYVFRNANLHLLHKFKMTGILSPAAFLRMFFALPRFSWSSRGLNLFELTSVDEMYAKENAYEYALKIAGKEIVDYIIEPLFYGNNFYGTRNLSVSALLAGMKFAINDVKNYCHLKTKSVGFLPEKLAEKVPIYFSLPVRKVQTIGNKVEVQTEVSTELFDQVVLALPATAAKRIYSTPSKMQSQLLSSITYSTTITVSFLVPAHAIEKISMGFIPSSESEMIASFVGQPVKGKEAILNGKGLLNIFLRSSQAAQLMNCSDETIFERVKPECIRVCPPLAHHASHIENYDLQRWPEAIPYIPPNFISEVNSFWKQGQGENQVYLCGDYLASPYVEGSIRCGKRVAESILTKTGAA
jgi:protoporphyrinogen/coproporphyrinogen III oxidase